LPRIQRTLVVQAPVDRVYQWWAAFRHLPVVMPRLLSVARTGPTTTRWRAEGDAGALVEWDAEVLHDLPQRQLEWEARSGPVPNRGLVQFEAIGRERTRLSLTLSESSEKPRGPGGSALLLSELDEGLARFQEAVETGRSPEQAPVARPYREIFLKGMAASAGVLLVAALAWGLISLIQVWLVILGAMLVAATLSPAVGFLERRGTPRLLAVTIPFVVLLAGCGVIALILLPTIVAQGQELAYRLPGYAEQLQAMAAALHAKHKAFPEDTQVMAYLADKASAMLGNAFSLTGQALVALVVLLSILFLSLFMLLDGQKLLDTLLRLIPLPQKTQLPALVRTVQERVGHYMLGLAVICVLAGLLTWGALGVMGIPYALLIGTVTTLMQAVPFVGPLIGGGMAALIALLKSPNAALWTIVVYTVIQQVIGQLLFPLIMGRTLGMHPVWIALALLIGGTLQGLTGAFLAIPVAIAISIVLECYYFPWAEAKSTESAD
jgi:predicted PurR-regulated permease PerM